MKTTANTILGRFGFKRVLVVNAIVSSLFLVSYGMFTASTAPVLILVALLTGGFFRSLEFTSINAIAFADIDPPNMSRATSFTSVIQQFSLSTGVAAGAAVIELSQWLHHDASLGARDFSAAFFAVAAISATSALVFAQLPENAGDVLRRARRQDGAVVLTPSAGIGDQPSTAVERPRNPVART